VAHEKLRFSRATIDRAGRTLLDDDATAEAIDMAWEALASWRSVHAFPLNTITMDLRQKVKRVRPGANVVQRLKRARSMLAKLQKEASMRLTQMQDIGGCRAVVGTIDEVYALREQYRKSKSLHQFVGEDDYIANPKPSGYRSLHLVYRFQSRGHPQYNRLMFEVQLRTLTQHAWATAVETAGAVLDKRSRPAKANRPGWSTFRTQL
jgi:ppGpp synthetase/RelA/SpoT-type nucleotidyltranferase